LKHSGSAQPTCGGTFQDASPEEESHEQHTALPHTDLTLCIWYVTDEDLGWATIPPGGIWVKIARRTTLANEPIFANLTRLVNGEVFGLRFAPAESLESLTEFTVHHSPAINLERTHGSF
jgi:hypothetical protein